MKSNRLILVIIIAILLPFNFISYALEREEENKTSNEIILSNTEVVKSKADLTPPQFVDDEYQNRIDQISDDVKLTYNAHVKRHIENYTVRNRNRSEKVIGRSTIYFPIFEEILAKHKIPKDLKYLAVIESTLNPTALSKAGAKGLWQFMPSTGRQYHLLQNAKVDERCDVYLATDAAASYLKDMNRKFDSWMLTIAAYNCGPGRVNKAIKLAGSRDIWDVYEFLPKETRGYIPAFISAAYLMNYYDKHEIYPEYPEYDLQNTTTKTIYQEIDFEFIASQSGVPLERVKYLNPAFKKNVIPASDEGYKLTLPAKNMAYFEGNEPLPVQSIVVAEVEKTKKPPVTAKVNKEIASGDLLVYEFKKGDNLWEVAKNYEGVSAKDIIKLNKIKDYRKLRAGTKLLIDPKI